MKMTAFLSTLLALMTGLALANGVIAHADNAVAPAPQALLQPLLKGKTASKIVQMMVSDSVAQSLLPTGLVLADSDQYPAGQHAVTLTFSQQTNFALEIPNNSPVSFADYNQMVLAVPNVRKVGGQQHYMYFAKTYVDSPWAMLGGNLLGFSQEMSVFQVGSNLVSIKNANAQGVVFFQFTQPAQFDTQVFQKNLITALSNFDDQVIGESSGTLLCSQFTWDLTNAKANPIQGIAMIAPAFTPFGLAGAQMASSLDTTGLGSFAFDASWQLSGPVPCAD